MKKITIALSLLTALSLGCGSADPDPAQSSSVVQSTASTLSPGTFYQSAVLNGVKQPLTTAGVYACQNDTWWLLQPVYQKQILAPGVWRDELTIVPAALDSPTQNVATLSCNFAMTKSGSTYLYSNQYVSCAMYTHMANQGGGWRWAGSVTIPIYGLQYFPATWNYTNGYWVIDVWPDSQYIGLPGFCQHFTVTIAG